MSPLPLPHNAAIALTRTWCAPGVREGDGAGSAALTGVAGARMPRGPGLTELCRGADQSATDSPLRAAAGSTARAGRHYGVLGRRHINYLRGAEPAPRFPTYPRRLDWRSQVEKASRGQQESPNGQTRKRGVATEALVLMKARTAEACWPVRAHEGARADVATGDLLNRKSRRLRIFAAKQYVYCAATRLPKGHHHGTCEEDRRRHRLDLRHRPGDRPGARRRRLQYRRQLLLRHRRPTMPLRSRSPQSMRSRRSMCRPTCPRATIAAHL